MSDYSVTLFEGLDEFEDFAESGLPPGVRVVLLDSTSNPLKKQGIFKLMQLFLLTLLKTPGSDMFSPGTGGGLKRLIGRPVSESLINTRRGEISLAVSQTEDQMWEAQVNGAFPPDERLQSASLREATYDFGTLTWSITMRLVSDAGSAADVLL